MGEELVPVASFLTMRDADMARGFLESNGIRVYLADGVMLSAGIELRVREEDAEMVREILADGEGHSATL